MTYSDKPFTRAVREWALAAGLALTACVLPASAQTPPPKGEAATHEARPRTYSLPPDKLEMAVEYARARHRLYFAGVAWSLLALAGVMSLGVAPRLRDWVEKAARRRVAQAFLFTGLLLLLLDALGLPVAIYSHILALRFQQSLQGWGSWFWDWTKSELIELFISGVAVWILYAILRRSPRRWWLYCWLASIPLVLFMFFLEPLVVEPMFYEFRPLAERQPALVREIGRVVARGGLEIPPERIFEMKASEKWNSVNAYVTGIGASKRVVVWDTTVSKLSQAQTLFVFGHEMGHYVLNHIWIGIGCASLGLLIGLFLGFHTMSAALNRWGGRWRIRGMDDWASLPVLMLALAVLSFVSEPVSNSISRTLEHNADIYGLEAIHGIVENPRQTAADAFQTMGEISLSDPNPSPSIEFWLYDHPSVADRVRFASEYNPWARGEPPRYLR